MGMRQRNIFDGNFTVGQRIESSAVPSAPTLFQARALMLCVIVVCQLQGK